MLGNEPFNLGHRAVEIVIHNANGTQSTALGQFRLGHSNTALRLFRRVSPTPKAFGLDLSRRGLKEDKEAIGHPLEDLRGALNIDFEDHISTIGAVGPRCAVEIAKEFGIFEEPALGGMGFELFPGAPDIGVFALARPPFTSAPGSGKPKLRISSDKSSDDGALAYSPWSANDDDHERWVSCRTRPRGPCAAVHRDRAIGECRRCRSRSWRVGP